MELDKIRVVIADDNKDLNFIIGEYLNYKDGIEVIGSAFNGNEAVDLIVSKEPALVILDILMPLLDGIGVLRTIKSMPLQKKPIFIMLSALGDESITKQALDLGADFFIVKPFDMDVLVKKIYELHSKFSEMKTSSSTFGGTYFD